MYQRSGVPPRKAYRGPRRSKGPLVVMLLLIIIFAGVFLLVRHVLGAMASPAPSTAPPPSSTPTAAPSLPPSPATTAPVRETAAGIDGVKGIYLPPSVMSNAQLMDNYISMAHETDINAFVITLKAEDGRLTYTSGIDCSFLDSIQPDAPLDLEEMLLKIKNEGIFVVGRICCFYDDTAPRKEQGMAVRTSGVNWLDYNYHSWLSPYSESARDYLTSIATEAARMGVDEIQLYDVAFPVQGKTNLIEYGVPDSTANRTAALTELLTRMNTALKETGTFLSVVMDYASIASEENKTGQDAAAFAGTVDVLCPELFPSSFARGVRIGGKSFAAPDAEPGGVVRAALESLMKEPGAKDAVIRPWLQGFTASWLGEGNFEQYGEEQIGEQTLAADDVTGQGWLVWEGDARYSADSLR